MIELKNITKIYKKEIIIDDFSYDFADNKSHYYIKGTSGIGKTTLLNIIAGITKPDNGEVLANFDDIAYMPCGNCLLEALTIKENLELIAKIDEKIIKKIQIEHILGKPPRQISSGEYKRALLARTLMMKKSFILLDEPTSNLDKENANIIIKTVEDIKDKNIIIATHDKRLMKGNEICLKKNSD